jgi:Fic family protein/DNA-binding XRE family transcriptional regulator
MKTLLKNARIQKNLKTREVAEHLGIDQALISKFENGNRLPTEKQLINLAAFLEIPFNELKKHWIKEKILSEIGYDIDALSGLQLVMESITTYEKSIPKHSDSLQNHLQEIDSLKLMLNEQREFDSYRITQALELEYTYESNRIEGNTLTLRETDLVVNEGLTISGKSMREHLEAINHTEAIEFIKDMVVRSIELNERNLLQIHQLVLKSIQPEYAGKYRNVQVMIQGSQHTPPQPFLVPKLMEDYFIWYETNKNKVHPVVLAAEMHERLVTIHPFIDGNGRTSRLVMNLILMQHGFVIAVLKGDASSRMNYYNALESVQTNASKEAFLHLIAETEKTALERYLRILGSII